MTRRLTITLATMVSVLDHSMHWGDSFDDNLHRGGGNHVVGG